MWLKWLPWRFIIKRAARKGGFLDPVDIFSRLEQFSQPSEVAAPIQLLRSGVVLHSRGLINSQAIQHNLDWVWPYWVECQFNPAHQSFIPRAFSITHINLTHRNWTAVGVPDGEELSIVDPRGLLTPFFDSWSIDTWIIHEHQPHLLPSRVDDASQSLETTDGVRIFTEITTDDDHLTSRIFMTGTTDNPICRMEVGAQTSLQDSWLVVSLRPYNPEGISFIHHIDCLPDDMGWRVNRRHCVRFDHRPDQYAFSYYRKGDVFSRLPVADQKKELSCRVGLGTSAAQFRLEPDIKKSIAIEIPLCQSGNTNRKIKVTDRKLFHSGLEPLLGSTQSCCVDEDEGPVKNAIELADQSWRDALKNLSEIQIPDEKMKFLFDAAIRTLILHSPDEVYPGPYTYKRFWFRDAAFILHAMMSVGMADRARRVLEHFRARQTGAGFFLSQDGEWDSNGEALWIMDRYCRMTNNDVPSAWHRSIDQGARWIMRKRLSDQDGHIHAGLFPPGFSAEHLGPNDYYYWDDFWGVAGLIAAGNLTAKLGKRDRARHFFQEAKFFMSSIEKSLAKVKKRLNCAIIPASPYRRMDAGCIGSIVGDYPLHLTEPGDPAVKNTLDYLMENCLVKGGFFQDMTHSGINPYLTLHMAQVLLRAGDQRYWDLIRAVADIASPTGQWPEAVHPHGGGCMGDGQHVWAAAEWVLMMRNCFVREERDALVLCSGIPPEWLHEKKELSFGPALTEFGQISVTVQPRDDSVRVAFDAEWYDQQPAISVRLPGYRACELDIGQNHVTLTPGAD